MQTKLVLKQQSALKLRFQPGATGPSGTVDVLGTITGVPGTNASVTNSGTPTAAQLTFTIPRGDVGPANSLAIGTVTTVPPSGSATASITGTAPDQVLNLGLPRGDQGPPGVSDVVYQSRASASASTIPALASIRTLAFAQSGDNGGATYKRVATQPSHAGKFRSVDRLLPNGTVDATNGGWWEIAEPILDPRMFGAVGDGATDNTTALQNLFDVAIALGANFAFRGKGTYKSGPLTVSAGLRGDFCASTLSYSNTTGDFIWVNTTEPVTIFGGTITGPNSAGVATSTSGSLIKLDSPSGDGNYNTFITGTIFNYGYTQFDAQAAFAWTLSSCEMSGAALINVNARNYRSARLGRGTIEKCRIYGTGGVSIGVLHQEGDKLRISDCLITEHNVAIELSLLASGVIHDVKIVNTDINAVTKGIYFIKGSGTQIANVQLTNCQVYAKDCIDEFGFSVNDLADISLDGSVQLFPKTDGTAVSLCANPVSLTGVIVDGGGVTNTTAYHIKTGSFHWNIQGGIVTAITTPLVNDIPSESTIRIENVLGLNPLGTGASATLGVSPATITAGVSSETIYLSQTSGGVSVSVGGQTIASGTIPAGMPLTINLPPHGSATIFWNTNAPTYVRQRH